MKIFRHIGRVISFLCLSLILLSGCQEEIFEMEQPPKNLVTGADSQLIAMLKQIALKDGSYDNVIDRSSCLSLKLPVEVLLEDQRLYIEDQEDLQQLKQQLIASGEDDVEIIFPVTVIYPDYTEVRVYNEKELKELTKDCEDEDETEDADIECVDLKYPLSLTVYDPVNQLSDVTEITNDQELYVFLSELEEGMLISFVFPLTLVLSDGQELEAVNNHEIGKIIRENRNACDERDENDFEEGYLEEQFEAVLTSTAWKVAVYMNSAESTEVFEGYVFAFGQEEELLITKADQQYQGEWEINSGSDELELRLELEAEVLEVFDEDWQVLAYSEERIEMQAKEGQEQNVRLMIFERIQNTD